MIFGSKEATAAIGILCFLIGIGVAILAFIFITPDKKRPRLNGFGKFLHDLCNFKFLIIEKIFQFFYIFATASVIVYGFFYLFAFREYWSYSYYGYTETETEWIGYIGLLYMILGPIVIRIMYELMMLAIIAIKNIIQINNKLKNQNDNANDSSPFANPVVSDYTTPKNASQFVQPTQQVTYFCPNCGTPKGANGICPNCGN